MTFEDPRKDRTALRLKLYENGFCPLPNHNKACFLPEWSKVKVTPDLIRSKEWARSRAWSDTGIRCGDVVAIDWDVNDKDLLNDLLDAVIEKGIIEESPFVRIGRPPRELWVYRADGKIGKRTTGAFQVNEDAEEEKVEILGGGCQFAAYGYRDEQTPYEWPEQSLLDAEYMDLPPITLEQVDRLKDFAIEFFEANGLQRTSPMAGTDGGYTHVYDLTPDMVFTVHDHGDMTLDEIESFLQQAPDTVLRCTVEALRPTSGSWAGMVSLVHGVVCLSDHGTYTAHFPAALNDQDATARLGALLAPRIEKMEQRQQEAARLEAFDTEDLSPYDPFDDNLKRALKRFVYVKHDASVYDLGEPGYPSMTVRAFRDAQAPIFTSQKGSRGGEVLTTLTDAWNMHPERKTASKAAMRPDKPGPLFEEEGVTILNTWCPPAHTDRSGSADTGMEMLRRLLPIEEERTYFLRWLRYKIEHPDVPGPGVVMVAHDEYGTGRGFLFRLLAKVFGQRYTLSIDYDTLAGLNSQSQYTEWREENVLIMVNEAQSTEGGSRWGARNSAYERLKNIVDPSSQTFNSVRKGVKNDRSVSYVSLIVATNHLDAFVIPEKDRRLAVLENGVPQSLDYWEAVSKWLDNPANIGAFIDAVCDFDMGSYSPFEAPPMTRSKADMVDSGTSELDRAVREVIASFESEYVVKEQITMRLEDYARQHGAEFPDNWNRTLDVIFRRITRKLAANDRVIIDGRYRYIRRIGKPGPEPVLTKDELIEEVLRNGPVTRSIATSSKVVAFSKREGL